MFMFASLATTAATCLVAYLIATYKTWCPIIRIDVSDVQEAEVTTESAENGVSAEAEGTRRSTIYA